MISGAMQVTAPPARGVTRLIETGYELQGGASRCASPTGSDPVRRTAAAGVSSQHDD
jgi:hypothetical protein